MAKNKEMKYPALWPTGNLPNRKKSKIYRARVKKKVGEFPKLARGSEKK